VVEQYIKIVQQNNISPFFSIIVPTKNRVNLLIKAVKSVLSQDFQNFELIVVDDGSTDDTHREIALINDKRIKIISNKGQGQSAAQNAGIEVASGSYLCFLDDDDFYSKYYLKDFYDNIVESRFDPKIIFRTGFKKVNNDLIMSYSGMYNKIKHKNPIRFVSYTMCQTGTLCIPKHILNQIRFDERYTNWQDTHFLIRLFLYNQDTSLVQLNSFNYNYIIHNEMGSLQSLEKDRVVNEYEINKAAIKDIFQNFPTVYNFVKKNTSDFLLAQKSLQYGLNSIGLNCHWKYFLKESLAYGIYLSLWKYYVLLLLKITGIRK
jgi:glycosyltransferase involved in cell wall biosynthesis